MASKKELLITGIIKIIPYNTLGILKSSEKLRELYGKVSFNSVNEIMGQEVFGHLVDLDMDKDRTIYTYRMFHEENIVVEIIEIDNKKSTLVIKKDVSNN